MKGIVTGLCLALVLSSCATTYEVSGEASSKGLYRIAVGEGTLRPGQIVIVRRQVCRKTLSGRGGVWSDCRSEKVGEAKVREVGGHESLIEPQGFVMDRGMRVEVVGGVWE